MAGSHTDSLLTQGFMASKRFWLLGIHDEPKVATTGFITLNMPECVVHFFFSKRLLSFWIHPFVIENVTCRRITEEIFSIQYHCDKIRILENFRECLGSNSDWPQPSDPTPLWYHMITQFKCSHFCFHVFSARLYLCHFNASMRTRCPPNKQILLGCPQIWWAGTSGLTCSD